MKLHITLLFSLFLLLFSLQGISQNRTADFEFEISTKGDFVEFKCKSGCIWIELSTTSKYFTLNQYGMVSDDDDQNESDYLISIERNEDDKIVLTGKKATAWTSLEIKFTNNSRHAIVDEEGVRFK